MELNQFFTSQVTQAKQMSILTPVTRMAQRAQGTVVWGTDDRCKLWRNFLDAGCPAVFLLHEARPAFPPKVPRRAAAFLSPIPFSVPAMSIHLTWVDYLILTIYFVFVIGIGAWLKRSMKSSKEFFTSGRSIPAWVTGLAFLSANLGAQEVIGMAASGAKYGIMTSHFYWVGAIPAMVFLAIFMMPFYYGSKARSVPEYLKLRFDEKTRGLNAITFAVMTIFSSGISLHALAKLMVQLNIGLSYWPCIFVSAFIVLVYIFLGGLTSAIYNEVLQFFMIVLGFAPLVYLGLKNVGGWTALKEKLIPVATQHVPPYAPGTWSHSWAHMGSPADNPMGADAFSMVVGLGFVLSFGYWCTDFLVVQRAMAAKTMNAARRTPLIAAFPQDAFPGAGDPARHDRHCLTHAEWRPLPAAGGGREDAGLRPDNPDPAWCVFSDRNSGHRIHGADGVVHVRHGRERDSVQHRVDLRSLPELHRPGADRRALPVDG